MEAKLKMIYWKGEKFCVGKLLESFGDILLSLPFLDIPGPSR
jgi:hypothetical protein